MKRRETKRYAIGIRVFAGTCIPQAHLVYHVLYSDGTSATESGRTVRATVGLEHLNGTKVQRRKTGESFRPDLFTTISAAATLLADIERACLRVDGHLTDVRTGKTKKPETHEGKSR